MAITDIKYEPQDYRTVYNPVEYVALSDPTARSQPRFKYVIEVYDGATLLGTLRVPADPNGYGRTDIHGIIENYLTNDLGTINTATTGIGITDNPNSYIDFTIKFGEEYETGGSVVVTMYPAFNKTVIVFNGCLPNYRGTDLNFVDYQATDYFENFTVNATDRKWLTNGPKGSGANKADNQSVELTDEGWLYFLYDHGSNPITAFDLTLYDASGSTTATYRVTNNIGAGTLADIKMLKIPFAPNTLNNLNPSEFSVAPTQPIITTETSYKITLKDTGSVVSEEIYFNIDSECRYEVRRLEFLNALGGFDAFNFTKVSRITEDVERKYYKQNPDNMTTGVITYALSDKKKAQYYEAY
jgi:hypothetical protein